MNKLHLGDCLDVLRLEVPDESVDLIYIDPPFNSKRNYNIFFDDKEIQTQRVAFEDTWSLKNIQDSLAELQSLKTEKIYNLLSTYSEVAPFAFPYLVMMSIRILEFHRVLKPTGSFYFHCDPTMSHYLKTICDLIFGIKNFRNEVIWDYSFRLMDLPKFYNRKHDIILFYAKSKKNKFKMPKTEWTREDLIASRKQKIHIDKNGVEWIWMPGGKGHSKNKLRRVSEIIAQGKAISDVWQIPIISSSSKERLGYPTQKPKILLERIIEASSDEGDTVLDAFCGCGTTVDAAEGLRRKWIGVDISPVAISLIKRRLKGIYGNALSEYEIRGAPKDEQSAIELWQQNPFAFQDWWITELGAFSTTFGKKGADKGVDGIAKYLVDKYNNTIKAAFQVKGGKVQSKDIDALLGAMKKHKCELGVFLSIKPPTKPMLETIATSGYVNVPGYKYPKLQFSILSDFFSGKQLKLPQTNITFESAKLKGKGPKQLKLI